MPVKLARLLLDITIGCCFDSHPRIDSDVQKNVAQDTCNLSTKRGYFSARPHQGAALRSKLVSSQPGGKLVSDSKKRSTCNIRSR
ncbi:MAG: hypothetical protein ACK5HO_04640 [Pseudomonadota bacterium]